MPGESVLVFGATGQVGSAAAQEAAERGSKVWLATRDVTKPLKWLSKEKEADGTYTRVQADLSDTASLTEAVRKSGAKSAFVYLVHGISSRPAFQALKDAGITWIVLLSSFTIEGELNLTKYPPETVIPYHHARGELDLRDVGIAYAAVRPGYFASNIFMSFVSDVKSKGEINLLQPDKLTYDWIVPENIGQVSGALLTTPQPGLAPTEPQVVYLCGPQFESVQDAVLKIGKVMGKEVKVNSVSEEAYRKDLAAKNVPGNFIDYIVWQTRQVVDKNFYERQCPGDQSKNIHKYAGKQPITLDQYLESVKAELTA